MNLNSADFILDFLGDTLDCRLWTHIVLVKKYGWVGWRQRGQEAQIISLTLMLLAFCKYYSNSLCALLKILYFICQIWLRRRSIIIGPVFFPILCISIVYFRWVNTLGMAALHGIDVVLRHSFFDYGYTHLVDQHFNPLPVSFSFSIQQGYEEPICIFSMSPFTLLYHKNKYQGCPAGLWTFSVTDPVFRRHLSLFPVGVIRWDESRLVVMSG